MAILDKYLMLDFRTLFTDFSKQAEEIEDYYVNRLNRSNNLGLLAFSGGVVSLFFSLSVAVLLLVLFLYCSQQSAILHTEMMMTRYTRVIVHLITNEGSVKGRE